MKIKMNKLFTIIVASILCTGTVVAQNKSESDTTKVKEGDRNVMLNAASANAGPRNVNIGLPASVGGTTVLENGLPVVYFFWPEMPFKAWRMDAMTNAVKLLDLGQTAINIGDVGFSVGTYDNLGTGSFQGNVALKSNHFGLINGTMNVSGPMGTSGFKYSLGAYVNFDPGTYKVNKNNIDRYFNDQTQMYKAALTKDYTFEGGQGSISAMYKFVDHKSMAIREYAPFRYFSDGSVKELDGFKIGSDNYILGQKVTLQDAISGKFIEKDGIKDFGSTSHTIDLIGKNKFDNGLMFNYIIRGRISKSGNYIPIMTGISKESAETRYFNVSDNSRYTGDVQDVMILASRKTPIKSLTSLFEVGKKSGNHDWKIGLNQWLFNIDKFSTEGVIYHQTVQANPTKLYSEKFVDTNNDGIKDAWRKTSNAYNNIPIGYEYHNGTENKTALFITDKWNVTDLLSLNLGARFEYHSLRGDYINNKDNGTPNLDAGYVTTAKKTDIKKDWFNKAFMVSAVYKVTDKFGLLGEATYNEQAGHLENYSTGNDPNLKKSKIPGAGIGVFYNHPIVSVVSKATYIKRDEYRGTVNFTSPATNNVARPTVSYDIETLGWTTDIVATPFKNFSLHALLTVQAPKYKKYAGTVNFQDGEKIDYNFNDKIVNEVSKVLIEIDPSYQWNNLRIWGSARYFSKQYANLNNSLTFKGRWETFAGANYVFNKNLDLGVTVVNLLNQRGARGAISGTDLMTDEQAKQLIGTNGAILSGTYIRPFTVEFSLKYKF